MTAPTGDIVVPDHPDERVHGPVAAGEREMLDHWLDFYRETVFVKIAGLDGEQLARRPIPPSTLSLIGMVRHVTEVEAYWLRHVLLDDHDTPDYHCTREDPDGDFSGANAATAAADVETYRTVLAQTRTNAAAWTDLDGPVRGRRRGEEVSLRWILTHLIEEYARHVGHMDLLREVVDGRTGY